MTLVVGRLEPPHLFVFSDSHLTERYRTSLGNQLEGVVKTRILTDTLSVSFAGNMHWVEKAFQRIEPHVSGQSVDPGTVADILLAEHVNSDRKTEFVLASLLPSPGLMEFKNGNANAVQHTWLGSFHAFSTFQGLMTGAITPMTRPVNTAALGVVRMPEPDGAVSSEAYPRLLNAMQQVVEDSRVPEVGGFVVPVAAHKGRLTYMDYATVLSHPINWEEMKLPATVPFGTAEQGGYAFALMNDRISSRVLKK